MAQNSKFKKCARMDDYNMYARCYGAGGPGSPPQKERSSGATFSYRRNNSSYGADACISDHSDESLGLTPLSPPRSDKNICGPLYAISKSVTSPRQGLTPVKPKLPSVPTSFSDPFRKVAPLPNIVDEYASRQTLKACTPHTKDSTKVVIKVPALSDRIDSNTSMRSSGYDSSDISSKGPSNTALQAKQSQITKEEIRLVGTCSDISVMSDTFESFDKRKDQIKELRQTLASSSAAHQEVIDKEKKLISDTQGFWLCTVQSKSSEGMIKVEADGIEDYLYLISNTSSELSSQTSKTVSSEEPNVTKLDESENDVTSEKKQNDPVMLNVTEAQDHRPLLNQTGMHKNTWDAGNRVDKAHSGVTNNNADFETVAASVSEGDMKAKGKTDFMQKVKHVHESLDDRTCTSAISEAKKSKTLLKQIKKTVVSKSERTMLITERGDKGLSSQPVTAINNEKAESKERNSECSTRETTRLIIVSPSDDADDDSELTLQPIHNQELENAIKPRDRSKHEKDKYERRKAVPETYADDHMKGQESTHSQEFLEAHDPFPLSPTKPRKKSPHQRQEICRDVQAEVETESDFVSEIELEKTPRVKRRGKFVNSKSTDETSDQEDKPEAWKKPVKRKLVKKRSDTCCRNAPCDVETLTQRVKITYAGDDTDSEPILDRPINRSYTNVMPIEIAIQDRNVKQAKCDNTAEQHHKEITAQHIDQHYDKDRNDADDDYLSSLLSESDIMKDEDADDSSEEPSKVEPQRQTEKDERSLEENINLLDMNKDLAIAPWAITQYSHSTSEESSDEPTTKPAAFESGNSYTSSSKSTCNTSSLKSASNISVEHYPQVQDPMQDDKPKTSKRLHLQWNVVKPHIRNPLREVQNTLREVPSNPWQECELGKWLGISFSSAKRSKKLSPRSRNIHVAETKILKCRPYIFRFCYSLPDTQSIEDLNEQTETAIQGQNNASKLVSPRQARPISTKNAKQGLSKEGRPQSRNIKSSTKAAKPVLSIETRSGSPKDARQGSSEAKSVSSKEAKTRSSKETIPKSSEDVSPGSSKKIRQVSKSPSSKEPQPGSPKHAKPVSKEATAGSSKSSRPGSSKKIKPESKSGVSKEKRPGSSNKIKPESKSRVSKEERSGSSNKITIGSKSKVVRPGLSKEAKSVSSTSSRPGSSDGASPVLSKSSLRTSKEGQKSPTFISYPVKRHQRWQISILRWRKSTRKGFMSWCQSVRNHFSRHHDGVPADEDTDLKENSSFTGATCNNDLSVTRHAETSLEVHNNAPQESRDLRKGDISAESQVNSMTESELLYHEILMKEQELQGLVSSLKENTMLPLQSPPQNLPHKSTSIQTEDSDGHNLNDRRHSQSKQNQVEPCVKNIAISCSNIQSPSSSSPIQTNRKQTIIDTAEMNPLLPHIGKLLLESQIPLKKSATDPEQEKLTRGKTTHISADNWTKSREQIIEHRRVETAPLAEPVVNPMVQERDKLLNVNNANEAISENTNENAKQSEEPQEPHEDSEPSSKRKCKIYYPLKYSYGSPGETYYNSSSETTETLNDDDINKDSTYFRNAAHLLYGSKKAREKVEKWMGPKSPNRKAKTPKKLNEVEIAVVGDQDQGHKGTDAQDLPPLKKKPPAYPSPLAHFDTFYHSISDRKLKEPTEIHLQRKGHSDHASADRESRHVKFRKSRTKSMISDDINYLNKLRDARVQAIKAQRNNEYAANVGANDANLIRLNDLFDSMPKQLPRRLKPVFKTTVNKRHENKDQSPTCQTKDLSPTRQTKDQFPPRQTKDQSPIHQTKDQSPTCHTTGQQNQVSKTSPRQPARPQSPRRDSPRYHTPRRQTPNQILGNHTPGHLTSGPLAPGHQLPRTPGYQLPSTPGHQLPKALIHQIPRSRNSRQFATGYVASVHQMPERQAPAKHPPQRRRSPTHHTTEHRKFLAELEVSVHQTPEQTKTPKEQKLEQRTSPIPKTPSHKNLLQRYKQLDKELMEYRPMTYVEKYCNYHPTQTSIYNDPLPRDVDWLFNKVRHMEREKERMREEQEERAKIAQAQEEKRRKLALHDGRRQGL